MTLPYEVIQTDGKIIKAWTKGVPFAENAKDQVKRIAELPFIHKHVAVMPDVHLGKGATVGSVIATKKAIIPAAVGVDIGCGMVALRTTLTANDLPDNLNLVRAGIEKAVPHGRTSDGGPGDRGAWGVVPEHIGEYWSDLLGNRWYDLCDKHPQLRKTWNTVNHLGTLGTGNHFIEVCLDETDRVWFMLHSGSRGAGNKIGRYFIQRAQREMERFYIQLPDKDLAFLPEGTDLYDDYCKGVEWAQDFAQINREIMMNLVVEAARATLPPFNVDRVAIDCHHNYVERENHFGENVLVTRKGAVRAREGDLGIIPGSMGARSYIVRGKGNPESFHSCSHGAGRVMSRTEAKKTFTVDDHIAATEGIECRKDEGVIDETPAAYKDIDKVMEAQSDLVDIVHTLRQVVCVKG